MSEESEEKTSGIEIHVPEADTKNLQIISRSDVTFAVIYAVLFVWGLILTLISI